MYREKKKKSNTTSANFKKRDRQLEDLFEINCYRYHRSIGFLQPSLKIWTVSDYRIFQSLDFTQCL